MPILSPDLVVERQFFGRLACAVGCQNLVSNRLGGSPQVERKLVIIIASTRGHAKLPYFPQYCTGCALLS